MNEIMDAISNFGKKHGVGMLDKVILPMDEFEMYGIELRQRFPHVEFEGEWMDAILLIHRDDN